MTAPATAILSVLVLAAADVSTETRTVTAGRPEYGRHSSFWRFHFGEGYRDLWTTPFEVEVLDLPGEQLDFWEDDAMLGRAAARIGEILAGS